MDSTEDHNDVYLDCYDDLPPSFKKDSSLCRTLNSPKSISAQTKDSTIKKSMSCISQKSDFYKNEVLIHDPLKRSHSLENLLGVNLMPLNHEDRPTFMKQPGGVAVNAEIGSESSLSYQQLLKSAASDSSQTSSESMSQDEFWQLVRMSYGEGLGPDSFDIDKTAIIEPKTVSKQVYKDVKGKEVASHPYVSEDTKSKLTDQEDSKVLSCESDTSESYENNCSENCAIAHDGKRLLNAVVPVSVDTLFSWLFTKSEFMLEFHHRRRDANVVIGEWESSGDLVCGERCRTTTYDVETSSPLAKVCHVKETQVLKNCSVPSELYSINVEVNNTGIPYGDTFSVHKHICLRRITSNKSSFMVFADIKYHKEPWNMIKNLIDKNAWAGMDNFYIQIRKLIDEFTKDSRFAVRHGRVESKKNFLHSDYQDSRRQPPSPNAFHPSVEIISSSTELRIFFSIISVLLLLNLIMVTWCWRWEFHEFPVYHAYDFFLHNRTPASKEDWMYLHQIQERLHRSEIEEWRHMVQTSTLMLKRAKECLEELVLCECSSKAVTAVQSASRETHETEP